MSWYEFLLFVHVTAAVIWLGGAFTFQMYGAVVRRGGDTDEIARFAERRRHARRADVHPPRSWSSSPASG